jgi:hypothetical protein
LSIWMPIAFVDTDLQNRWFDFGGSASESYCFWYFKSQISRDTHVWKDVSSVIKNWMIREEWCVDRELWKRERER